MIPEHLESKINKKVSFGEHFISLENAITTGKIHVIHSMMEKGYYTNALPFCLTKLIKKEDRPDILEYLYSKKLDITFANYDLLLTALKNKRNNSFHYLFGLVDSQNNSTMVEALRLSLQAVNDVDKFDAYKSILNMFKEKIDAKNITAALNTIPDIEIRNTLMYQFLEENIMAKSGQVAKRMKI